MINWDSGDIRLNRQKAGVVGLFVLLYGMVSDWVMQPVLPGSRHGIDVFVNVTLPPPHFNWFGMTLPRNPLTLLRKQVKMISKRKLNRKNPVRTTLMIPLGGMWTAWKTHEDHGSRTLFHSIVFSSGPPINAHPTTAGGGQRLVVKAPATWTTLPGSGKVINREN